ncbi:MAG: homocysteine S-methyltransferase family protein [Candidatus Acidiferrales bacterium]
MKFTDCVRGTLTLADGAWGTELQKLGAPLGSCLDEWNLLKPELVRQVAESYIQAGSKVILTNTFRANPISLAPYGLDGQCAAINRAGVKISREAAGREALVFASMGPSGKMLVTKEVTPEQLHAAFSAQAGALAEESPDALLIETMIDVTEARIAAAAALETGLPVIVSFVYDSGKNRDRTIMGATPEQVATAMVSEGVHGIGANCGVGAREYVAICKRLVAACHLPILMKPNAGLPEMVGGVAKYKTTPEEFAESAKELANAGATFVGGCCGTSPEFIGVLAGDPAFRARIGLAEASEE